MIKKFIICEQCETGINNDDWTFIDANDLTADEAEEVFARMASCVEAMGNAVKADQEWQDEISGAYDCWVCSEVTLGPIVYLEWKE